MWLAPQLNPVGLETRSIVGSTVGLAVSATSAIVGDTVGFSPLDFEEEDSNQPRVVPKAATTAPTTSSNVRIRKVHFFRFV
jgi:hypothetical protein